MRSWPAMLLLCPALLVLAPGCQSMGGPASGADDPPATQAGDQQPAGPYQRGPVGIDDDSDFDRPNPVVQTMLSPFRAIGDGFEELFALPVQAIRNASGDTPRRAVLLLEDKNSPDNRRDGINRLMEYPFTKRPPYTTVYEGMARQDDDATVRAAALRACNISRDRRATPQFIKSLSDKSDLVRLEAAKGLANMPDPNAAAPLISVASNSDENRDVRVAAVDALKYYRTLEVARGLSALLSDSDFSVAWQARRSLVYLTHKDFGYDQGAWLGYFAGPDKPLG